MSQTRLKVKAEIQERECNSEMDMMSISKESRLNLCFPTEISDNEIAIKEFRCSINDDIIMLGKLYLTNQALYFLPSLKVFKTKIRITYTNIKSIVKTASGIKIVYDDESSTECSAHFFSFLNRSKSFTFLSEAVEKYSDKNAVTFCHKSDDCIPPLGEDSSNDFHNNMSKSTNCIPEIKQHDVFSGTLPSKALDNVKNHIACSSVETTAAKLPTLASCEYDGEKIIDDKINFTPDEFKAFFMDPNSTFLDNCKQLQNIADYKIESQQNKNENGHNFIEVSYSVLKAYMGKPVYVQGTITELGTENSKNHKDLLTETTTRGAPYADTIKVYHRYCIMEESPSTSTLKIFLKVEFIKNVTKLFKGKIMKETQSNAIDKINIMMRFLKGPAMNVTNDEAAKLESEVGNKANQVTYKSTRIGSLQTNTPSTNFIGQCLQQSVQILILILLFVMAIFQYINYNQINVLLAAINNKKP